MLTVALRGERTALTLCSVDEAAERGVLLDQVAALAAVGCPITTDFVRRAGFATCTAVSPEVDAARELLAARLEAVGMLVRHDGTLDTVTAGPATFDRLSVIEDGYVTDFALTEPEPAPDPADVALADVDDDVDDDEEHIAELAAAKVLPDLRMAFRGTHEGAIKAWRTRGTGRTGLDHAAAHDRAEIVIDGDVVRVTPAAAPALIEDLGTRPDPSDLTRVHIVGHPNLFASVARNNLRRKDMPQIPADHLDEFKAHLAERGIHTRLTTVDPATLKATQNELDGRKVGMMIHAMRTGTMQGTDKPVWISSDGKLLDGHHRWAAEAVLSLEEPRKLTVVRVDVPMTHLIGQARQFAKANSIAAKHHGMAVDTVEFSGTSAGAILAWKSRRARPYAEKVLATATAHVDAITADISAVVHDHGGGMIGLANRMKALPSLTRKIRDRVITKGGTLDEAAKAITDAVRFTALVSTEEYASTVHGLITALDKAGYQVHNVENHWKRGDAYNGLHMLARHRSGMVAELQVHTPESMKAKDEIHARYEDYRKLDTPEETRLMLFEAMRAISDQAPVPRGVMDIGTAIYRPHEPNKVKVPA